MIKERKIKRNPLASWRLEEERMQQIEQIEDEGTLKNLDRGVGFISFGNEIFELNLLGAQIWLLCDGEKTKKDIIEALRRKYVVSEEKLLQEVDEFLSEMANFQLVTYE